MIDDFNNSYNSMQNNIIRIEFWNGQLDKKGNLVKTKHNPCLWTNVGVE